MLGEAGMQVQMDQMSAAARQGGIWRAHACNAVVGTTTCTRAERIEQSPAWIRHHRMAKIEKRRHGGRSRIEIPKISGLLHRPKFRFVRILLELSKVAVSTPPCATVEEYLRHLHESRIDVFTVCVHLYCNTATASNCQANQEKSPGMPGLFGSSFKSESY